MKIQKSTVSFKFEGLEPRIMLSAVPMDGGVDFVEEPLISESIALLEQESLEANSFTTDSLDVELFSASTPLAPSEVFLSGVVDPNSVIDAQIIHVLDGTILDSVVLTANYVELGEATWSGSSRVITDDLNISADQASEPGAILTLGPRTNEASIALGFNDTGFAIDASEIDHLSAGEFGELTIGLEEGAHDINIDGLQYVGNLLLRSPNDGGEFYILSQIQHSGGYLKYEGSGQTQNTSADTVTSGNEILVDDSLQLIYTEGTSTATNKYGDNTIYLDTTNGGAVSAGADILISGDILGTSFGGGGKLYLNAGTEGNLSLIHI